LEQLESRRLLSSLPTLDAGVLIKDGADNLTVDGDSAPCVGDWNGDGKKDLIVGQFTAGNVLAFINGGSDAAPSFAGGTALAAAGVRITTSYG
jgi:hypothetical protein